VPGIGRAICIAIVLTFAAVFARAEVLTVAVASNFAGTAERLASGFEQDTGFAVRLVTGSSGKIFAQIANGAPFDVFLSADQARPEELEQRGLAVSGSRITYALGRLVLWSRDPEYDGSNCLDELARLDAGRLAIANPRHAPYGVAARDFLRNAGLWERFEPRLLVGENIAQTLQFAATGGARFALVAASQLLSSNIPVASCSEAIASDRHAPIRQQAVLLRRAVDNKAALGFLEYLKSPAAIAVIKDAAYDIEEASD
jgi:molybdate transport system substrate-binding protein